MKPFVNIVHSVGMSQALTSHSLFTSTSQRCDSELPRERCHCPSVTTVPLFVIAHRMTVQLHEQTNVMEYLCTLWF